MGTHQPRGVAELLDLASPVVSTRTSLHTDQTWFESRQEWQHLHAAELFAQYYRAPAVDPVDTKNVLCQINAERCNLHGRILLTFLLADGRDIPILARSSRPLEIEAGSIPSDK